MVNIQITKKNNAYVQLEMSGHAKAGSYGNDLVCAALTGIVSGALNAYDLSYSQDVELIVDENKITIQLLDLKNHDLQITFAFLVNQLKTIVVQYPQNVVLKEVN